MKTLFLLNRTIILNIYFNVINSVYIDNLFESSFYFLDDLGYFLTYFDLLLETMWEIFQMLHVQKDMFILHTCSGTKNKTFKS